MGIKICEVNFIHVFHLQNFTVNPVSIEAATACCGTVVPGTGPVCIDLSPLAASTSLWVRQFQNFEPLLPG
ncbi:unnamed protein product [Penicillium roqueforti FM164]|uniref:Genomic scaffold, ProqFM164S03 n=1 Tax=Penicillium roqueforti (strain FM164) TaxID=1365484 RepID=W6QZR9_PENRF|nr:unnamed protein product [Penicillium roqueforti FM164]